MRVLLFKSMLVCIVLTAVANNVFGHKSEIFSRLPIHSTSTTGELEVTDQWYSALLGNMSLIYFDSDARLILGWDNSHLEHYSDPWTVTLHYDITTWDDVNVDETTLTNQEITIGYDPVAIYNEKAIRVFEDAVRGKVTITSIDYSGGNGDLPDGIYMDLAIASERYRKLNPEIAIPTLSINGNPTSDGYLEVSWSHIGGAESYDLEWLFVDVAPFEFMATDLTADFRDATRINTTLNCYKVPLIYPRGQLFFRVRCNSRIAGWNTDDILPSNWSHDNNIIEDFVPMTNPGGEYVTYLIDEAFASEMTWKYSASYAEDGLRKEVASFYDEMLRTRQSVTLFQSSGTTFLGESVYDGLGRQTFNVLPHAVNGSGVHFYENQLYQSQFLGHCDYSFFDRNSNYDDPGQLSQESGAGKYYSENNDVFGINSHVIPDADGYVYARTKLKNDGSGRIVSQSNVGLALNEGSGHETKFAYGAPEQVELDRLFGNEAGLARTYQKVVTTDPNGQSTVSYIDGKGRTVATALTGPIPKINGQSSEDENKRLLELTNESSLSITSDLTAFNEVTADGNTQIIKNFIVTSPQDYLFAFELSGEQLCLSCNGFENECYASQSYQQCEECKYDLYISIKDEYGNIQNLAIEDISYPDGEGTVTVENQYNNGELYFEAIPATSNFDFTVNLPAGQYQIEKRLSVNESSIDAYIQTMRDAMTPNGESIPEALCFPYSEYIEDCKDCVGECISQYLSRNSCGELVWEWPVTTTEDGISTTTWTHWLSQLESSETEESPIDPFQLSTSIVLADLDLMNLLQTNPMSIEIRDVIKDIVIECVVTCDPATQASATDPCDVKLAKMKADLSPGGQFFDNRTFNELQNDPAYWDDWMANATGTSDPNSVFEWTYYVAQPVTTWALAREHWDDSWADDLLSYHPEYCVFLFYCENCDPKDDCEQTMSFYEFTKRSISMQQEFTQGNGDPDYEEIWTPILLVQQDVEENLAYMPFDIQGQEGDWFWQMMILNESYSIAQEYGEFLKQHLLYSFPKVSNPTVLSDYKSIYYILDQEYHINTVEIRTYDQNDPYIEEYINAGLSVDFINFLKLLHGKEVNGVEQPGLLKWNGDVTEEPQLPAIVMFSGYYNFLREYFAYWLVQEGDFDYSQGSHPLCDCAADMYSTDYMGYIDEEGCTDDTNEFCPNCNPETNLGFTPLFPENEYFEMIGRPEDNSGVTGLVDGLEASNLLSMFTADLTPQAEMMCELLCDASIDSYLTANATCLDANIDPVDVRDALREICHESCSVDFPSGSNESPLDFDFYIGYTNSSFTLSVTDVNTFDEVLTAVGTDCPSFIHPEANVLEEPDAYNRDACSCERILNSINEVLETSYSTFSAIQPTDWQEYAVALENILTLQDTDGTLPSDFTAAQFGASVMSASSNLIVYDMGAYDMEDLFSNWKDENSGCDVTTPDISFVPYALECGDIAPYTWTPETPLTACEQYVQQQEYEFYYWQNQQVEQYLDELEAEMRASAKVQCFAGLAERESFTMNYILNEFNYTLYFYDQADNLIKTVPPEGVHPLQVPDINAMDDAAILAEIENSYEIVGGVGNIVADNISDYTTVDVQAHRIDPNAHPFVHTDRVQINTDEEAEIHTLETYYKYNSLNQLINQETPDGGIAQFWYDPLGRIVLSQNSRQARLNGGGTIYKPASFSYILYDELGRAIESGVITEKIDEGSPLNDLAVLDNLQTYQEPGFETFDLTSYDGITKMTRYLNQEEYQDFIQYYFTKSEVTKSFYDIDPGLDASAELGAENRNLRGRIASVCYWEGNYSGDLESYSDASHYVYDIHGNVKLLMQDNPDLKVLNQRYKTIQYDYDLISGRVHEVAYQPGNWDQYYHRYCYDDDGRITLVETSKEHILWQKQAKYFYYAHGPLARVELGKNQVYGSDFAYTIQGWLKGVNGDHLNAKHEIGKDGFVVDVANLNRQFAQDAFGFSLYFFEGDYAPIDATNNWLGDYGTIFDDTQMEDTPDLYNGNIPRMITAIREVDFAIQASGYKYDRLNRMRKSRTMDMTATEVSNEMVFAPVSGMSADAYKTNYTYDGNGNLISLNRYNKAGALFDAFSYDYSYNGNFQLINNKLNYVEEAQSDKTVEKDDLEQQSPGNYEYDALGQLLVDNLEKIKHIEWTTTAKIREVLFSSDESDYISDEVAGQKEIGAPDNVDEFKFKADLEFQYDAMGQRKAKIVKPKDPVTGEILDPTLWDFTYYARDASGNVLSTYERKISTIEGTYDYEDRIDQNELFVYGTTRLGLYRSDKFRKTEYNADLEFDTKEYIKQNPVALTEGQFVSDIDLTEPYLEINWNTPGPLTVDNTPDEQSAYFISIGEFSYELTNHLGNVMAVITDRKVTVDENSNDLVDFYSAEVIMAADYYPFGMEMPNRSISTPVYRFGYQGQESDSEISGAESYLAFTYRVHDVRLGRFLSVDPLAYRYAYNSSYAFSENRVLDRNELEGLETGPTYSEVILASEQSGLSQNHASEILFYNGEKTCETLAPYYKAVAKILLYGAIGLARPDIGIPLILTEITGAPVLPAPQAMSGPIVVPVVEESVVAEEVIIAETKSIESATELKDVVTHQNLIDDISREGTVAKEAPTVVKTPTTSGKPIKTDGGYTIPNSKWAGQANPRAGTLGYDVPVKSNGYPDFSKYLYQEAPYNQGVRSAANTVKIELSGSYAQDEILANAKANFKSTPEGYTWHHTENYDGKIGQLELVRSDAHEAARHSGGAQLFREKHGWGYD